jgi:protein-arginine kinase activator protein McsA
MTHKNYPDTHCPLTGKICAKLKTLKITELNKGDSINFGCCESCSATWAEQFSKQDLTPVVKPENLNLGTLPDAIKELADLVFGQPIAKAQLPKITVSHDLTITPKLLQEAAMRVAKKKHADITCPGCKTTLEEMTNQDRLGCPQCYDTFARYVLPLLEGFHGSTTHKGKVPKNLEIREIEALFPPDEVIKFKIASLHDEKRDAISDERYERAGEIVKEVEQLQLELLDLSEASLKSECPSEDASPQIDQLPQQKDEDQ